MAGHWEQGGHLGITDSIGLGDLDSAGLLSTFREMPLNMNLEKLRDGIGMVTFLP